VLEKERKGRRTGPTKGRMSAEQITKFIPALGHKRKVGNEAVTSFAEPEKKKKKDAPRKKGNTSAHHLRFLEERKKEKKRRPLCFIGWGEKKEEKQKESMEPGP